MTSIPSPLENESRTDYTHRLNLDGQCEVVIRKGLRQHFGLSLDELSWFFDDFPEARFRHIAWIRKRYPNQNEYAFQRKVSADLGVDRQRASQWITRFEAWKREADEV